MRRYTLSVVAAASVVAGTCWIPPTAAAQDGAAVERAVVTFDKPVQVADRFLAGSYIIEHDEKREARGEPCTHVYKGDNPEKPGRLAVAFFCIHRDRAPVDRHTVTVEKTTSGSRLGRLEEFQFAGSADGHGVPR